MSDIITIRKWFASEVKDRMDEMDLRPDHLLSLCNINERDIQSCLNGTVLPSLYSLVLLSDHLDCTVNDLLGFEEIEEVEVYEQYSASDIFFNELQYAVLLGERVRRYLDGRCVTMVDLAKKAGITAPNLRYWFSKTKPHLPTTENLIRICDALKCTPSELLGY